MAGNSFNDFSSLKSLKKELEKNEAAAPSKVQNEPRKKTVKLKSKSKPAPEERPAPVIPMVTGRQQ